jgi:protein-L-isoaspartate(D-aspartate) O-methyltransferase
MVTTVPHRGVSRRLAARFASRIAASAIMLCAIATSARAQNDYDTLRKAMIDTIEAEAQETRMWTGKAQLDKRVIDAMRAIPRHEFVPPPLRPYAYLNRPLPVGHGQTVSQPFLVALMVDLAEIKAGDKVLLIGLGGGYDAAILEKLAGKVYCLEMEPLVAEAALNHLLRLGHKNVEIRIGDPYYGWRGASETFDAIIVRQATDFVPPALVAQTKPGGRIVIPTGTSDEHQDLTVAQRRADGQLIERRIMPVRFTRLPGGERL